MEKEYVVLRDRNLIPVGKTTIMELINGTGLFKDYATDKDKLNYLRHYVNGMEKAFWGEDDD